MSNFVDLNSGAQISFPNKRLLVWYNEVKRELPWREKVSPYNIWLSEIMLQQTRVEQGLPYYERFTKRFPTVHDLARASEDDVLKLWEGLGYYSRARNLHATAKYISNELGGSFPDKQEDILKLKGVGPYTAAAIGSIAFALPVAAVDGNVYRVLSRYFSIEESIDETAVKRQIGALAQQVLDGASPGDHNQAMMELGATVCTPKKPNCGDCPLNETCIGFSLNRQSQLPIRTKKVKVRNRYFYYIIEEEEGIVPIVKRGAGDVWQGLFEFRLVEKGGVSDVNEVLNVLNTEANYTVVSVSDEYKHVLSHQRIFARFIHLRISNPQKDERMWVSADELSTFAFPRLITRYLENYDFGNLKEVSNI